RQRELLSCTPRTVNDYPAHIRRHDFKKIKQRKPDADAARGKQHQEDHGMEDAQRPWYRGQAKYHADDKQRYCKEAARDSEVGDGSSARKADQRAIDAGFPGARIPKFESERGK